MKRGQAFDTMMLVISVIVAIAILGILLNILQNVGNVGVNDPKSVMAQGLEKIYSQGFGITEAKQADFKKDSIILKREIIGKVALDEKELEFNCEGTFCSATFGTFGASSTSITAKTNTKAYIAICGDDSRKQNPKYCVGIGRQGSDATTACTKKCQLK